MLTGAGEPLVVPTSDLAPLIESFIRKWEAHRNARFDCVVSPNEAQSRYGTGWKTKRKIAVERPMSWLARESGINERRLYSIRTQETRHVCMDIADRLLHALDVPFAWHDGTVRVIKNPRMTEATWVRTLEERGIGPDEEWIAA